MPLAEQERKRRRPRTVSSRLTFKVECPQPVRVDCKWESYTKRISHSQSSLPHGPASFADERLGTGQRTRERHPSDAGGVTQSAATEQRHGTLPQTLVFCEAKELTWSAMGEKQTFSTPGRLLGISHWGWLHSPPSFLQEPGRAPPDWHTRIAASWWRAWILWIYSENAITEVKNSVSKYNRKWDLAEQNIGELGNRLEQLSEMKHRKTK